MSKQDQCGAVFQFTAVAASQDIQFLQVLCQSGYPVPAGFVPFRISISCRFCASQDIQFPQFLNCFHLIQLPHRLSPTYTTSAPIFRRNEVLKEYNFHCANEIAMRRKWWNNTAG